MLIRLLVVALTLVGPMPFRACTCAASIPVRTPSGESAPRPTPTPKRCGCEHGAASGEKGEAGGATSAHAEGGSDDSGRAGGTPHRDRHERDCPATDPSPVVRDAVTPSGVDAPIACADPTPVVLCRTLHPSNTPVAPRLTQPRTPKLPLYITLLSIQN